MDDKSILIFWTILKLAVSKQERVEDYPRVETQFNSVLGHINVTHAVI